MLPNLRHSNAWGIWHPQKGLKRVMNAKEMPGGVEVMPSWIGPRDTLQEINISHLGKRKIIFKMPFLGDMLVPWG